MVPLHTERLTLRPFTGADAPVLAGYRADPEVARYQSWSLPYTDGDAAAFVESQRGVTGPVPGDWVQIAVDDGEGLAGDVAVGLSDDSSVATIGFTLRPDRQGKGLAREAVGALVDALFEQGVHRIEATIDPRNVPSARLLEQLGFLYEGRSRSAVLVRGEWQDDDRYALLPAERRDWLDRPTGPPAEVRLVPITPDNARAVDKLATHQSQSGFVATVAGSYRDALFPSVVDGVPVVPWFRAVEADGELAGFVMLAEVTDAHPHPYLWRLLVDRRHQRRGIGRHILALLVERLRAEGHDHLRVSWVPGPGSPEPFYLGLGFVPTGEVHDGEIEAELRFA